MNRGLAVVALSAAFIACGNDSPGGAGAAQAGASASGAGASGPSAVGGLANGGSANGGSANTAGATTTSAGATVTGGGAPGGGAPGGGAPGGGAPSATAGAATSGGSGGIVSAGGSNSGGTSTGGNAGGNSVSCPSSVLKAGDSNQTISIGAVSRSYVLHVPAKYDGSHAVPLVVDFHGMGSSGPSERSSSSYPAQTDADGAIVVFPTGMAGTSGNAWNVGPCCVANVDDVAFAKALVAQVLKTACIDRKRIYAVGFSMGGGMSHYLACHAGDVFAAVAPAAFDLLEENVDDCKPARPITVVSFRSTGDPLVTYAGGYSSVVQNMPITFLGAKATFAKWAQLNQCQGAASAEDSAGCATYATCAGGVEVVLCTKQGGGHDPGNASVAWPILKKHVLP